MSNPSICRICGAYSTSVDAKIIANGNNRLVECSTCTSVHVDKEPMSSELLSIYNALFQGSHYGGESSLNKRYDLQKIIWTLLLQRIERTVSGRKLVEIGGGVGAFGQYVTRRGWQYINYDISEVAVAKARKIGLCAHLFDAATAPPLPPESADAIVMLDVIEHIWFVHEYLNAIMECLVPSGLLLIKTPNYLKRGYKQGITRPGWESPPIHLNFFTEDSLTKVLLLTGFSRTTFFHRRIYRAKPWTYACKIAVGLEPEPNIYLLAIKPR